MAVRAVQLDPVKACPLRVLRPAAIVFNDASDLGVGQGTRRDVRLIGPQKAEPSGRGNGTRRHRRLTIKQDRMGNAPDMPKLQGDAATSMVHGIRDPAPASDLLIRPYSRSPFIADGERADASRLPYDHAR